MLQYYPRWVEMPAIGQLIELVNRQGNVEALGIVIGLFQQSRYAKIKLLELEETK